MSSAGAAGAAALAAAIAQAVKASGVLVRVEPEDFRLLLERNHGGLVVTATGGFLGGRHDYLMSYKGLAFFTRSKEPIELGGDVEVVAAQKIWIPS
ncbi:MAG TPA: hypothetical protein VHQ65_11410 [Thermoanaerobaculia bacterium]|nr:hypothetical protein [Thermoanaerobaculia bacterium]